jgi:hypothetical protein
MLGYEPERGYAQAMALHPGRGVMISAGCRWFTLAEAREHWGPDYPDPQIAAGYRALIDFVEAEARRLGWTK